MATINDIAFKLGIAKSTVSKALNNSDDISETLRKRVLETAVEMGYEKKRIRKDNQKKLCILIENMDYKTPVAFGYDIVMGFKKLALPAGWQVELADMTEKIQLEQSYDTFMLQNQYEGAFVLGFSLKDPWMTDLKSSRAPAVLYDNYIQENPAVSYIGVNNDEGFDMAVAYLKGLGHTRIGYLGGAMEAYISKARYHAYARAMEHYNLPLNPRAVGFSYHISECVQNYLPILLENRVTAILCAHDALANAVMTHCTELGYRIPEDISIIGFDDAPICAYTAPPLTTIRQDRSAIGRCGYYALVSLLDHAAISSLLLTAQLIVRDSTGAAKIR